MELRHLRYFVAVAEEGNFTRAAARLHMQQPPLSQQLQALERELGVRLFNRLPRGVELTAAGAAFLEDSRSALAHVEASSQRARRVASGAIGTLSIGIATSAATQEIVPRVISEFRRRHPGVDLTFVEGNAATLSEAVLARRADVALVRAPVDRAASLRYEKILQEPLLAAIATSHPLVTRTKKGARTEIPLKALANESFILVRRPGAPGIYADLVTACGAAGFEPRIAAEVGNMLTNILLVAAGVGVSVVPASMRGIQSTLVSYLSLRGAGKLTAPLTLIHERGEANPSVARFVEIAREHCRAQAA
jgi:DNA-binding transcriptional LysR family regulator